MARKEGLSNERSAVAKRLKRRGIISSPRGIETEELVNLWERYKSYPVIVPRTMIPPPTNYEMVVGILDNLVEDFDEFFVGRFREAYKLLPELRDFKNRINPVLINADRNFIPHEITIEPYSDSDWLVDSTLNMYPDEVIDHLKKMFYDYLY